MKNLNLSYVLFGVFIVTVVSVLFFGRKDSQQANIEVLSFPNPEEVKEEVKAKVEEAKKDITTTIENKVEEIETRIQEALPSLDIPALKEEIPVEEAPVKVEAPTEVVPTEEAPVEEIEGESNGD